MRLGWHFPAYALSTAIAEKANQGVNLIAIQCINRVVESPLGILLGTDRQRIIDSRRPLIFFKCTEDCALRIGRHFEPFD